MNSPPDIMPGERFWLNPSAVGHNADGDHLKYAQRIKLLDADDFDAPSVWGYEDMFRRGWCRIYAHDGIIEVGTGKSNGPTSEQGEWIEGARLALGKDTGVSWEIKRC